MNQDHFGYCCQVTRTVTLPFAPLGQAIIYGHLNLLMHGHLKPISNGPLYSNTVSGTLSVDGWAVTFGIVRRGLDGLWPRPVPSSLYQM